MAKKPVKTEEDLFIQEVDEDLRQDQAHQLWQDYGKYAVALAVLLVVGVAGFKGWQAYDISSREAASARFSQAMKIDPAKDPDAALKAFQGITADGKAGYPLLARFQQAKLLAKAGNAQGAADAYRALSGDKSIDEIYRNLAIILGSLQELNTQAPNLEALEKKLQPLAADDSTWRFSAREISGIIANQTGDKDKARKLFSALAEDRTAPQGVRARAQEMLSILGK
ncbi:MAG: tetratricopeptide repeat protein [Proteobacteria bacterium]|nr:tetratricopeptide repeat protein [Pseudomonadota bacterium]